MTITINSSQNPTVDPTENAGQPSALLEAGQIDADLDASYPNAGAGAGGYPLTTFTGATVVHSVPLLDYDSSTLRWLQVVNVSGTPKVKAYANTNGAKGAEVANTTDLSGHTGAVLEFLYK